LRKRRARWRSLAAIFVKRSQQNAISLGSSSNLNMSLRFLFVPVLLQVFVATAHGQRRADVDSVVRRVTGCYGLALGEWNPRPIGGNERYHRPPQAVRLDTILLERDTTRFVLLPHSETSTFAPGWNRSRDSLTLSWSNGFSGVYLRLAIGKDTLRGTAHGFTDYIDGKPTPAAPVVLSRLPCT
jgi:hypothetical protein